MIARVLLIVAVLALANRPDEGQWLPQQVLAMDWQELQARGLTLTKDQFWNPEKGGVLSAAVQLGGCSASFVSPDGLVVTNHHCGFGAVNQLSSVEHNYLRDGFVAGSRQDELPAPGVTVFVVRRIEDVTDRVHAAQAKATTDRERWFLTEQIQRELVAEGQQEPNTTCNVASFLEGQEYYLYYRTRLRDVRLVYTPPRSVGEFGGEVDNWEWPRHTGDFSFFRAYVAPDGSPSAYHEDNVPFHPEHYLSVSGKGVREDDLVMILGYPGRTERYLTSVAVQDRQSVVFPIRYRLYTLIIDILEARAAASEEAGLRFASMIKSLSNVQKNASGMIVGLARNAVVERKLREEAAFRKWVEETADRQREYGTVLDDAIAFDREASSTLQKEQVLRLLSSNLNGLLSTLIRACAEVASTPTNDEFELSRATRARLDSPNATVDFGTVQQPMLDVLLDEARALPEDQWLAGTEALTSASAGRTTHELVASILSETTMLEQNQRVVLFAAGPEAVAASEDPLVVLARGIAAERQQWMQRDETRRGRSLVVGQRWIEAQEAWRGTAFYPDANGTLRVSIASIKAYEPHDGIVHVPHTTVGGVLEKETGQTPFASPKRLLDAAAKRQQSRFFDREIGDVPVCFLSDGDTTGGNSGSPVINGHGELVGLNFDRVFENVAGDYGWLAERSRNISVDIRYVLWIMDQVMPAPHLLEEMGV